MTQLSDTEIVLGFRMRLVLGAPGAVLPAFDQAQWVITGNYAKRDTATALEQFFAVRKANLGLLKSLRPAQWKHFGLHAERGHQSVELIAQMTAGHDLNHICQIEGILKRPKRRPGPRSG